MNIKKPRNLFRGFFRRRKSIYKFGLHKLVNIKCSKGTENEEG